MRPQREKLSREASRLHSERPQPFDDARQSIKDVSDIFAGVAGTEAETHSRARQLMRQVAPGLVWITMHDIDIAHAGTYSLYVDGIRRTDRLCAEMWKIIQSEPEYAGKTTLLILPDFGRDADDDPGGNGFQHHRTGDPLSRTTWLMALGPGIREGVVHDRPVDSVDLVPTIGSMMGFSAALSRGTPIAEIV